VPSIANPVFATTLAGMQDRARAAGLSVLIAQSDYDPVREVEAVEALLAERPVGLALTVCDPATSEALSRAERSGIPVVLVHNEPGARRVAAVAVDNRAAARALVAGLVELGHRRIAFVAGCFSASDRSRLRHAGYVEALRAAGLAPSAAIEVDFIAGAEDVDLTEVMERLRPTAVVASNDLLALSVVASLRRLGFEVPRDVSVTGFDGIALGRLVHPALATVEQPARAMGVSAISLLLDRIAGRVGPDLVRVDHRLRLGGTLASPPAGSSLRLIAGDLA
jgi:DNA-binding LacI/PurR family transcriptional regulator